MCVGSVCGECVCVWVCVHKMLHVARGICTCTSWKRNERVAKHCNLKPPNKVLYLVSSSELVPADFDLDTPPHVNQCLLATLKEDSGINYPLFILIPQANITQ